MRIILITSAFAPQIGGVETHVGAVARELRQRGHQVTVLVRHGQFPPVQKLNGTAVYRLPGRRWQLWLWILLHSRRLSAAEVFHSHDYFLPQLQRLFGRRRFVHTFHGYEGYPIKSEAITVRRTINDRVDASIAVGGFIEKWYGTKTDLITYGGINPIRTEAVKTEWDLLYFGRLEPDTGITEYLTAFDRLLKTGDYRILIIGDGSLRHQVAGFASQHPRSVELRGRLPQSELYPVLNHSRVACVSGYLAILEAAFFGKIVVANYNTPIKHDYLTCHPLAEQIIIAADGETMAQELLNLLAKPKVVTARVKIMQQWAKQQTWSHLTDQYLTLYKGAGHGQHRSR